MLYDCVIVGGGFAGLQAAIQLGRYRHHVAVIDAGEGRSSICKNYHNLIGFPDGISGAELLASGKSQAKRFGTAFIQAKVIHAERDGEAWKLTTSDNQSFRGKRLLLATGVKDRLSDFRMLIPCMGNSVFVCPDCDGYEVSGKPTLVLGAGNAGARMALTLTHWTSELIYVNHERVLVDDELRVQLEEHGIPCIEQMVRDVILSEEQFKGIVLDDGTVINRSRCFIAFGGNEVRSDLARQLGVELMENKHIRIDPRTKLTSVKHVWAAGDVAGHSEMVTIAMGDGSQAAIWIHKSLITASKG
ncbi:NAD(P)/FAD-dependent oxidoreductase [Paenibacillus sp. LPE1-1-1.1]|uniref:NAD(P)/FAD-dependent oxidoreductase n=1 Tax=Paenibacillus sp. LPE1-1-1.1 TaxID=3135230 RepID=UPI003442D970